MRIIEVGKSTPESAQYLREIFELRARIFHDKLSWSVTVKDGCEYDEFDELGPVYVAVLDDDNRVVGTSRMLPCSGPTMIGTVFSSLVACPYGKIPASSVESSRFCVDTQRGSDGRGQSISVATSLLISGMIGWAAMHEYPSIVTVTDVRLERLLRLARIPFSRLGSPTRLGNMTAVAGLVPVSLELAETAMPKGYVNPFITL